jgi:hypothetical protein
VTTTHSADYLRRLLEAIETFSAAFEAWMETQVESDHLSARGLFPTVWAKEGQEELAKQRALDVAEAAGLASRTVAVTGAYVVVSGVGAIDPVANWFTMEHPKALLSPADVRSMTASIKGRLKSMLAEAEADAGTGLPAFGPFALHPVIWAAAAPLWTTHRYRVAVREAAEALTVHWKAKLGRHDVDDTVFWQQTLAQDAPVPGRPRLAWPGEPSDKTVKSMRGGLGPLATGLNLTVRNVTTHTQAELSEQEAVERLGAYSYFARLLDECQVVHAEEQAVDA